MIEQLRFKFRDTVSDWQPPTPKASPSLSAADVERSLDRRSRSVMGDHFKPRVGTLDGGVYTGEPHQTTASLTLAEMNEANRSYWSRR